MSRQKPDHVDSELDALIAKIHGLAGVVHDGSSDELGRRAEYAMQEQEAKFFDPVHDQEREHAGGAASGQWVSPRARVAGVTDSPERDRRPVDAKPNAEVEAASDLERLRKLVSSQGSSPPPRADVGATANPGYGGDERAAVSQPSAGHAARVAEGERSSSAEVGRGGDSRDSDSVGLSHPLAGLLDFVPSRDEPWRPHKPDSLDELGVGETTIEHIIMRFLLAGGESHGRNIAAQVKLAFGLIEPILERLKNDQLVAYRRGTETGDYVYVLTEAGRRVARGLVADCTYYGACPVSLKDYIHSVKAQTVEGQHPRQADLERAFADLLIDRRMLTKLGPAINSGRGMFLYGFPGNGKTSIAERVTSAFGRYVWVPRALLIDGEIMRVYDRMNHEEAMPESHAGLLDQSAYDKRWVRIKRPTIVVGGELTMDMLEVQGNADSNISEAPLQLKSNCGTLVIDDFGRQKMSVDQLLNRWIVPLEKRYDFLNMRSGKKIQVPFDQLVIFSTNLEPKDLVDDAFLRRIPYKIEVRDPCEADFRKLFEIMCRVLKIPYSAEPIDYLVRTHYLAVERPFRNCQPRDLLLQVRNYCMYLDQPVELRNEYFDFAVDNYFSIM